MPEDSKKNQQKTKNEPKEQRRRRGRQHAAPIEKKVEKPEPPKVAVAEKPIYEPPPPEFYKNLKRETDEILKITEEANTKYKKKEIQSNWAKYEMPIESYEEIDEQENLGADYEALIQAPLTVGGHFQFKHEKSWDISTGPSPYDKYFDINMESLNVALSTIPFYERNNVNISIFSESDMQSMVHRATKFKQKYYNDKKFTTPDLEAQGKILNSLRLESDDNTKSVEKDETIDIIKNDDDKFEDIKLEDCEKEPEKSTTKELVNENKEEYNNVKEAPNDLSEKCDIKNNSPKKNYAIQSEYDNQIKEIKEHENLLNDSIIASQNITIDKKIIDNEFDEFVQVEDVNEKNRIIQDNKIQQPEVHFKPIDVNSKKKQTAKESSPKVEPAKNPVIESPEDLEKWLDDFLDG